MSAKGGIKLRVGSSGSGLLLLAGAVLVGAVLYLKGYSIAAALIGGAIVVLSPVAIIGSAMGIAAVVAAICLGAMFLWAQFNRGMDRLADWASTWRQPPEE